MDNRVKAIVWDYDGTLAWSLPQLVESFNAAFAAAGLPRESPEAVIRRFGPPDEMVIARAVPRERYAAAVRAFYRCYRALEDTVEVPEAVCRWVRQQGHRVAMGLVSNKGRVTTTVSLRAKGLASSMAVVVTGDDVARPKPAPEGLARVVRRLGAAPAEVIYVGDSPSDVVAAAGIGARSLWVGYGRIHPRLPGSVHPTWQASRPEEVVALLERALGQTGGRDG